MPQNPSFASGRRIQTRRSGVHGKGVFAVQDIAEGETIIEYVGEVVTWKAAQARHPHDPKDPNHTFYFHIDEKHVIDAKFGGNSSRSKTRYRRRTASTESRMSRYRIQPSPAAVSRPHR